jgi:methionyl-tRNA formyltransferase
MQMDAGVDTGPMIEKIVTNIPLSWTVKDLIERIKDHGPRFLQKTLWSYLKGELKAIPQDGNKATLCSKISKEDGLVDIYHDTLEIVYNKRRAYYLWPKTYFVWKRENGKEIQVSIESITIDEETFSNHAHENFASCILHLTLQVKPE